MVSDVTASTGTVVNVPAQPQAEAVAFDPSGRTVVSAGEYAGTAYGSPNSLYVAPSYSTSRSPLSDTYTSASSPGAIKDSETLLKASSSTYKSFLKFDVSDYSKVSSAKLRLFVNTNDAQTGGVEVRSVSAFDTLALTYNNMGTLYSAGTTLGVSSTPAAGT